MPKTMERWANTKSRSGKKRTFPSNYYHDYFDGYRYGADIAADSQPYTKQKAERTAWREKFKEAVAEHRLESTGMRDMPEHCLLEKAARKFISVLGTAVVALQLICAWLVLSLLFRIPLKTD